MLRLRRQVQLARLVQPALGLGAPLPPLDLGNLGGLRLETVSRLMGSVLGS